MSTYHKKSDMHEASHIEKLHTLLQEETVLLETLVEQSSKLYNSLMGKNWGQIQKKIDTVDAMSAQLHATESLRHNLCDEIAKIQGMGKECTIGDIIRSLPSEEQRTMMPLHRKIRVFIIRLRSITTIIAQYISEITGMVGSMIKELIPSQRMYDPEGKSIATEQALVVDRQL